MHICFITDRYNPPNTRGPSTTGDSSATGDSSTTGDSLTTPSSGDGLEALYGVICVALVAMLM